MSDDLFATSDNPSVTAGPVDGRIPYFAIDGIFRDPLAVREAALALPYSEGTAHYPGRVARFPPGDPSLTGFLRKVVTLVARDYLPRLPENVRRTVRRVARCGGCGRLYWPGTHIGRLARIIAEL